MEDMYVHQQAKEEPNRFRDGTVIGANAHTCSPPTQSLFLPQIYAFSTCIFIYTYTYIGANKILQLTDIPLNAFQYSTIF